MSINQSYFDRWAAFAVKKKNSPNPFKVVLSILKWIVLLGSVVIFFWGMGTLFFNTDVSISQIEALDENNETVKVYKDGVFFEVIAGQDENLKYKEHVFNLSDGDLYEYDYLSTDNFTTMWEYSNSPFYVLFVLPISWLLTTITRGLGWENNNLSGDYNLMVMIVGIFLTSFLLRTLTVFGSWKQQQKKEKMKLLQRKTQEIKEKHKDNTSFESQQKMQMEIMNLYRQENINPLSSALEGFLFAPLLFAMFVVVRSSRIIKDSSTFDFSLTATIWDSLNAGLWVYLIPFAVYVFLLSFDTFLMPRILKNKPQKKIIVTEKPSGIKNFLFKWGFKILFIVFFFLVPVGTSVYWIFSSFFEILQKFVIAFFKKMQKQKMIAEKKGENFHWWNIKTLFVKN